MLFQDVGIMSLDCSGKTSWLHGSSLVNYMKLAEFNGLSGKVSFDNQGLRTQFNLEVMELRSTGLESIGILHSVSEIAKIDRPTLQAAYWLMSLNYQSAPED